MNAVPLQNVTPLTMATKPKGFFDAFGVFLSQICLAHCFLLPAVLAILPNVDLHAIPGGEALHFGILLLATPTAIYALLSGSRFHGRTAPLQLGVLGLAGLWSGTALDSWHGIVSHTMAHSIGAGGSFFLILAHLANRRAVRAACTTSDSRPCC